MYHTSKVLPEYSDLHEQKSRERVWLLKVWDNGASLAELAQADFLLWAHEAEIRRECHSSGDGKGSHSLLG